MNIVRILCMIVCAICMTGAVFNLGFKAGRESGYAICVAEEDEDYPRTRKF